MIVEIKAPSAAGASPASAFSVSSSIRGIGRRAGDWPSLAMATPAMADAPAELVAAAKQEGQLTTIALPHDWCGYGGVIDGFKAKYGHHRQRTQSRRRLGRRDRGDQGQQGQYRPAGAGRDRRRPVLRPVGQGGRADPALQGRDLGHDPGQRQGCRRLLVRRLLRRAGLRGEQGHRQERAAATGPTCWATTTGTRWRWPAIRAPPTRRSRASMPPGCRPAARPAPRRGGCRPRSSSPNSTPSGNFVPVIGKAASLAQGSTPIIIRWDYNALADRDTLNGNPPVEVVVPEDRRRRRRLCPGDQRLRAASERRQAVDGVSLFGRGPARLARRAIATRSASTTWPRTARSRRRCWTSCRRPRPTRARCSRRWTSRRPPRRSITKQWDTRGRRQRPVDGGQPGGLRSPGLASTCPAMTDASIADDGAAQRRLRPRQRRLGCRRLARRRAVLRLRADVPDRCRRLFLVVGGFQDADGNFTLDNIANLFSALDPQRLLDLASRSAPPRPSPAR